MNQILLITSSPRGAESLSTRFATEVADGIKARSVGVYAAKASIANTEAAVQALLSKAA